MSEINHSQLEQYLKGIGSDDQPPVGLIHGQEMLVEQSLERLMNHLLSAEQRDMCCEVVEGAAENLPDALERMNTFALLAGPKIIIFKNAELTEQGDYIRTLYEAIDKGFPPGHHLMITTSVKVPKNSKLYKTIRDHGLIVDCHVPLGGRRSDKLAQQNVLQQTLKRLLAHSGKHLAGGLFEKLCRLTGFDLRTFAQNVEKLIAYTGQRQEITGQDIDHVLRSTKSDPVYEFTNAVADRNGSQALQLMNTLLRDKWHPLQILSALANQIRKLLIVKDFTQSESGRIWSPGISYHQFQHQVLPAVRAHDDRIQQRIEQWQASNEANTSSAVKKSAAEMRIASNPRNPYPVYQMFVKSDRFTHRSLVAALFRLNRADLMLKSSGRDAALVLQSHVLEICGDK
jgi:DNA polymerase-3 subunit delta